MTIMLGHDKCQAFVLNDCKSYCTGLKSLCLLLLARAYSGLTPNLRI